MMTETMLHARVILSLLLAVAANALAQAPQNPAEMAQRDEPAVFKARVNLVAVPVVVRDRQGKAIGTLTKDDFLLFDRGKPQYTARFSMEKAGTRTIKPIEIESVDPTLPVLDIKPVAIADVFTAY